MNTGNQRSGATPQYARTSTNPIGPKSRGKPRPKKNIPMKKKYIKRGAIANDFGEGHWMTSYESGHYFHVESPTMFDQTDASSVEGMAEYMEASNQMDLLKHLGAPFFVEGNSMHKLFGPHMSNYISGSSASSCVARASASSRRPRE